MTTNPVRGEVWRIWFDLAEGDEIKKPRTAVVVSENANDLGGKVMLSTVPFKRG
jgi:mRNA-degrading endonuclease toxin of MazEF toxin-antitoxin module